MVAHFDKKRKTKFVLGSAGVILLFFVSRFTYEYFAYRNYSKLLENYGSHVIAGTPKKDVLQVIGNPDSTAVTDGGERMIWSAGSRQGKLTEFAGLSTVKGHFELEITFDSSERVVEVYRAVN